MRKLTKDEVAIIAKRIRTLFIKENNADEAEIRRQVDEERPDLKKKLEEIEAEAAAIPKVQSDCEEAHLAILKKRDEEAAPIAQDESNQVETVWQQSCADSPVTPEPPVPEKIPCHQRRGQKATLRL